MPRQDGVVARASMNIDFTEAERKQHTDDRLSVCLAWAYSFIYVLLCLHSCQRSLYVMHGTDSLSCLVKIFEDSAHDTRYACV